MSGMARDAWVSSQVDKLLEQATGRGGGNPMLLFEEIEPQQARALLESAMKATRSPKTPPPVSDSYSAYHAFARARLKALPPGRKRPAPLHIEAPYSRERRAMLAAEFLASDAAEHLSDPSAASRCADHIIDYGCEQDFSRPLRVSPTKCETFLLRLAAAQGDANRGRAGGHAARAARRGCASPPAAPACPTQGCKATLDAMWEATGKFPEAYRDPTIVRPGPTAAGAAAAGRRPVGAGQTGVRVPVPPGHARRIELDLLNPADEADRRVLLEIDHGGDHARLEEHLAWHEEIAAALWEGDPPQLWEAAQRLLDLGHDRHDVLHVLIEIAERIGDDPEELAIALDDIADIPDEPRDVLYIIGEPW